MPRVGTITGTIAAEREGMASPRRNNIVYLTVHPCPRARLAPTSISSTRLAAPGRGSATKCLRSNKPEKRNPFWPCTFLFPVLPLGWQNSCTSFPVLSLTGFKEQPRCRPKPLIYS